MLSCVNPVCGAKPQCYDDPKKGRMSMISFRQFEIQRRALLATAVSLAATLLLPRGGHGAETDAVNRVPRIARQHPNSSESSSGDQMPGALDLKTVGPAQQVTSIRYSNDTYYVTTNSGTTASFPEFNLRFKTDSSAHGPAKGRPVLLPASMRTDRAFLVFADPREISAFIAQHTQPQIQS